MVNGGSKLPNPPGSREDLLHHPIGNIGESAVVSLGKEAPGKNDQQTVEQLGQRLLRCAHGIQTARPIRPPRHALPRERCA